MTIEDRVLLVIGRIAGVLGLVLAIGFFRLSLAAVDDLFFFLTFGVPCWILGLVVGWLSVQLLRAK